MELYTKMFYINYPLLNITCWLKYPRTKLAQ